MDPAAAIDATDSRAPRTSTGVRAATGREREEWFAVLDEWGAPGRAYREIADWLVGEQGLSRWWAQKLIVEYEQARGLRRPGVRPDGTFTVTASKSVGVPVERVFDAVARAQLRAHWLPGVQLRERTVRPGRSVRFDWPDDASRVGITIITAGDGRCQIAVEHSRLPDTQTAERAKADWRQRLAVLKAWVESADAVEAPDPRRTQVVRP